jgi:outer membrane protein TolC
MLALTGPSPEARRRTSARSSKPMSRPRSTAFSVLLISRRIQPIYTFGKISSYKLRLRAARRRPKPEAVKKASDIILRTKELYFGLVLAKDLKKLASRSRNELEKSAPPCPAAGRYRLAVCGRSAALSSFQTYLSEVQPQPHEIEKNMAFASDALATSMGLPRGTVIDPADTTSLWRNASRHGCRTHDLCIAVPRGDHAAERGLKARQALVDAEKSSQYPMIFAGLQGVVSGATNRDVSGIPISTIIFYSSNYAALFLGLKWGFDFGITKGRIKEAEAEYNKLVEKKRFADEAIPLQVRKALSRLLGSDQSIADTDRHVVDARKCLVSTVANYDVGIGDAKGHRRCCTGHTP